MMRSRMKLIALTGLSVTILFSVPRLAVLSHLARNSGIQPDYIEFMARATYTLITAIIFLTVNLRCKHFQFQGLLLDMRRLRHALPANLALAMLLHFGFFWLHHAAFDPVLNPRLFRFFFTMSFYLEVALVIALANMYRLFLYNQEIKLANEQLLKVNAETRYQALVSQMDPHYLFNSLNTAAALIRQDGDRAIDYISDMSHTLRYILESGRHQLVPLLREAEFCGAYCNMLTSRYGEKLVISCFIDDSSKHLLLPPMALQLLIENAVKHNSISKETPLAIDIAVHGKELVVANTLRPKKHINSMGVGLSNLNERCRHLYRKEIIVRKSDTLFTVIIPLIERHEHTDS